jgi:hypothetical protein
MSSFDEAVAFLGAVPEGILTRNTGAEEDRLSTKTYIRCMYSSCMESLIKTPEKGVLP